MSARLLPAHPEPLLRAGLAAFALYHALLAVTMAVAPHAFFSTIGAFGVRNDHFIRDLATYAAAVAVGLGLAVGRPAWRPPLLAVLTVQFALHALNHLVDVGAAATPATGVFDLLSLSLLVLPAAWLWRLSTRGTEASR